MSQHIFTNRSYALQVRTLREIKAVSKELSVQSNFGIIFALLEKNGMPI